MPWYAGHPLAEYPQPGSQLGRGILRPYHAKTSSFLYQDDPLFPNFLMLLSCVARLRLGLSHLSRVFGLRPDLLKPLIQPSNSAYEIVFLQAGGGFHPLVEGSPPLTPSSSPLTPGSSP
ncbi:uncharacterized protein G2W53_007957 [Senna tora]|uniref:Uncharacterized protein n=1 Tax=Senna tora TaxID=362788 RepID=A0A835CGE7_9FABA|nr:uncharacterized protein G2W53_007957 [Senna tora]